MNPYETYIVKANQIIWHVTVLDLFSSLFRWKYPEPYTENLKLPCTA